MAKLKNDSGRPFIVRYKINEEQYIQILKWKEHQRPHHTEKESVIPTLNQKGMGMGKGMGNLKEHEASRELGNGELTVKTPLLLDENNKIILSKSPEFQTIWQDYLEMRKKIRKPATEKAKQLILSKLNKLTNDEKIQIKILEQSVENSWQGVFELKTNLGGKIKNVSDHHPHAEPSKYDKF